MNHSRYYNIVDICVISIDNCDEKFAINEFLRKINIRINKIKRKRESLQIY